MMQLVASILALGVGPILDKFSHKSGPVRAGLDSFTFVAMLGLILGHILPEAFHKAGWLSLLIGGVAWFGPTFFEHRVRSLAERAHTAALLMGAFGLIAHGTFDGMGLVALDGEAGWTVLALAVVLHRIPAGLTLWWLVQPKYGALKAQAVLGGLALSTVLGYWGAEIIKGKVSESQEGLFQALVGGALLHVVMHRTGHNGDASLAKSRQNGTFIGCIIGALLLSWMFTAGAHAHASQRLGEDIHHAGTSAGTFLSSFLSLAKESAPALVLAFTMAGLIQVFLPSSSVRWMSKGGPFKSSLKGMAFGLPLPICSCGVVPLYRSLAEKGVPIGASLAFLIATPELGIDAVLLSLPLLGSKMAAARIVAAAIVAISTAWLLAKLKIGQSKTPTFDSSPTEEAEEKKSLVEAIKIGWMKFFDTTAPWIVLGLVVAAICQPLLPDDAFESIPSWLQVPLFAVIGIPLYVCASGATPIVAVFLLKGISPGAAIAFLLTGPATNITTFGLLKSLHGKKLAVAFVIAIVTSTVAVGWITNIVLADSQFVALEKTVEEVQANKTHHQNHTQDLQQEHQHANESHGPMSLGLHEASLLILGLGLLLSLYRQGPQGFISHVFSQAGEDDGHGHDHSDKKSCCGGPPPEEKKSCCQS